MQSQVGYESLTDILEIINHSQRGKEDPLPIHVLYTFVEPSGAYEVRFTEKDFVDALMEEGYAVGKEDGFYFVRSGWLKLPQPNSELLGRSDERKTANDDVHGGGMQCQIKRPVASRRPRRSGT